MAVFRTLARSVSPDKSTTLTPPPHVDTRGAASYLNISSATLHRWRMLQTGPPYLKLGGFLVRYDMEDLKAFVYSRKQ